MAKKLRLGDMEVDVTLKQIKNIHLSVHPPTGRVRISAPSHMKLETIRLYTISKLSWIKRQQKKLQAQERETPREYIERESHYLWGKRYLLKICENGGPHRVELTHNHFVLHVRPGIDEDRRRLIVEEWYRSQIKQAVPPLIDKWEPILGVKVARFFVQRMKTRWGSCNHLRGNIRLNTELAKKPPECLEYLVVHEMVHLLEPAHNTRFVALMDQFMPKWRFYRDQLNRFPVSHEKWAY